MAVRRDLVVVGGSAGSVEVLQELFAGLPGDLPATVLVVAHVPATGRSALARILDRAGPLEVLEASNGQPMKTGRGYVAVPDRHLLVEDHGLVLSAAPHQNNARPAIDALFRSAARWYGPRTIGVVLSGALDDGAAGLAAIEGHGGAAIVQDPTSAMFPGMPCATLAVVPHAVVCPAGHLAAAIIEEVGHVVDEAGPADPQLVRETAMTANGNLQPVAGKDPDRVIGTLGVPVGWGCPECGGGLSAVSSGAAEYFRCHVGHVYSPQNLLVAQHSRAEAGLWTTVSMLEEEAAVHGHLAERAADAGASMTARHQRAAAEELLRAAQTIRKHFPAIAVVAEESV